MLLKQAPQTCCSHVSRRRQRGASMVEYLLLVALIAMIAIPASSKLGESVTQLFTAADAAFTGTVVVPPP